MAARKITAKGRTRESRHIRLYGFMTNSPAWADLSGNAVKLLVYLATWENGSNNGELFLSERLAAEGIQVAKRTAAKLFDELESHGFIAPTMKGYFSVQRAATQWRLTWLPWAGKPPTNEWRSWSAEKKTRVQLLHDTGAEIAPVTTVRRATGAEIAPVEAVSANPMGAEIAPHTIAIGEGRSARTCEVSSTPKFAVGRPAPAQSQCGEAGQ